MYLAKIMTKSFFKFICLFFIFGDTECGKPCLVSRQKLLESSVLFDLRERSGRERERERERGGERGEKERQRGRERERGERRIVRTEIFFILILIFFH